MKKAIEIIKTVLTEVIFAVTLLMMAFTVISVTSVDKNNRNIFGYSAFIVKSDSMNATDFNAGDLVFSKVVDPKTLREGDIISFQSTNPESRGEIFTHKIRRLTTDENGNPGFITYGTSTNTDDESIVTYSFVLGKCIGYVPRLGEFFAFLKTTPGYILCVLLPFLYFIILQGFKSLRLADKYKSDLYAEIEEERAREKAEIAVEREKIIEERKKQEEMLQELLRIQVELRGNMSQSKALTKLDSDILAETNENISVDENHYIPAESDDASNDVFDDDYKETDSDILAKN